MITSFLLYNLMNSKPKTLLIINIFLFLVMVTVNALAILLPLNGNSTEALANADPNLFVPAGLTFSIWSLIYIYLLISIIYQIFSFSNSKNNIVQKFLKKQNYLFALTCIFNSCWLFCWHYRELLLSIICMLLLLTSLIILYMNVGINAKGESPAERWRLHLPFSIYLGWIIVATIANITSVLVHFNWSQWGLSQIQWACIMIGVATIISFLFLKRYHDIIYAFVIIWAFTGIIIKRTGTDVEFTKLVVHSAYVGIAGNFLLCILHFKKWKSME